MRSSAELLPCVAKSRPALARKRFLFGTNALGHSVGQQTHDPILLGLRGWEEELVWASAAEVDQHLAWWRGLVALSVALTPQSSGLEQLDGQVGTEGGPDAVIGPDRTEDGREATSHVKVGEQLGRDQVDDLHHHLPLLVRLGLFHACRGELWGVGETALETLCRVECVEGKLPACEHAAAAAAASHKLPL
eukprot:3805863-Rhodomonas_salina.1